MRDAPTHDTDSTAGWLASLELDIALRGGASIVARNRHHGPLRVQKPLYPEGAATVHAILVHPPAGIRAGDRLQIAATVGQKAHAFLTSPGATKWYRCDDGEGHAHQSVRLAAGDGAALEWMPQETIYFDGARAVQRHVVHLGAGARYIGCDVLCFGRQASGERFARGELRLHSELWCGGELLCTNRPASMQAPTPSAAPSGSMARPSAPPSRPGGRRFPLCSWRRSAHSTRRSAPASSNPCSSRACCAATASMRAA